MWARLRYGGIRTSRRRALRLMRVHGRLAPSRTGPPHGPRAHAGAIIPQSVDVMWGTDLTTTITGEAQAAVFVAVDHGSAECVGIAGSGKRFFSRGRSRARQGLGRGRPR